MPIIHQRIKPDSVVYSDTFASYSTLSAEGYHHVRINHDDTLAEPGGRQINGIENFWIKISRGVQSLASTPGDRVNVEWRFEFTSWAAGSTVNFTALVDGVESYTDSFQWAASNDASIVLGSRGFGGGTAVVDNVVVSTVPEPGSLALLGLGGLLIARRRRQA